MDQPVENVLSLTMELTNSHVVRENLVVLEVRSSSSGPNGSGENGSREERGLGRSMSLRQRIGSLTRRKNSMECGKKEGSSGPAEGTPSRKGKDKQLPMPPAPQPDVRYIPGRSSVGRVL